MKLVGGRKRGREVYLAVRSMAPQAKEEGRHGLGSVSKQACLCHSPKHHHDRVHGLLFGARSAERSIRAVDLTPQAFDYMHPQKAGYTTRRPWLYAVQVSPRPIGTCLDASFNRDSSIEAPNMRYRSCRVFSLHVSSSFEEREELATTYDILSKGIGRYPPHIPRFERNTPGACGFFLCDI